MARNPLRVTSHQLERFAKIIGERDTLKLAAQFAGRSLHVPYHPRPDSELVQVIGQEAATKLGKRFGANTYSIPLSDGKRARIIYLRYHQHKSIREIAAACGCTERHVKDICRQLRESGGSADGADKIVVRRRRQHENDGSPIVQRDIFDDEPEAP